MKPSHKNSGELSRQFAVLLLASAIALPVCARAQSTGDSQSTPPAAAEQQQPSPEAQPLTQPKEGFWGRVNPFARKKWVKKQLDPINDRLSELDEVNARNARDIKDVDARAQAGIHQAQSTADAANQAAQAAGNQAQAANTAAQQASGHVDAINTTVLTSDSRQKLDELASSLTGRQGYILEMEAHSPASGSVGISASERMAESVKRYLVEEHQIPVYRLHSVALGNAQVTTASDQDSKPERIRTSSVHIRLMENSLAAQAGAQPQSASASTGAEQP